MFAATACLWGATKPFWRGCTIVHQLQWLSKSSSIKTSHNLNPDKNMLILGIQLWHKAMNQIHCFGQTCSNIYDTSVGLSLWVASPFHSLGSLLQSLLEIWKHFPELAMMVMWGAVYFHNLQTTTSPQTVNSFVLDHSHKLAPSVFFCFVWIFMHQAKTYQH